MSAPVVEGWSPLGGRPAASDEEIFEVLTAAVFQARFRPAVVRACWPCIRQGFAPFAPGVMARWPDLRLDELMQSPGMIRNRKKILATRRNARDLEALAMRFGSALAYLRPFGGDEEALVRDIDTWAHYIGAPSIRWSVRAFRGSGTK
ncbi:MAG TPA: DNA-3-methyladenine glycosylase I [Frateuria sp.]|uniref:DNA-3-methyladenine glycosylase I n=1 Tax=Frateuria sp. TaxID=2211372 RepID=UPI002DF091CE|nr:DNA-3-methyladenine glycosylase I [Frateuria sp.]